MKRRLGSGKISPPAGFEPATPWSEVGSANWFFKGQSGVRDLLAYQKAVTLLQFRNCVTFDLRYPKYIMINMPKLQQNCRKKGDTGLQCLSRIMTKPTKWPVPPAKTQISLGIRPVWLEFSLCAQRVANVPRFHHADSEDYDQAWRTPRQIWVFFGALVLSCGGSILCRCPSNSLLFFRYSPALLWNWFLNSCSQWCI